MNLIDKDALIKRIDQLIANHPQKTAFWLVRHELDSGIYDVDLKGIDSTEQPSETGAEQEVLIH